MIKLVSSFRIVVSTSRRYITNVCLEQCLFKSTARIVTPCARKMSQKSITSFFKITPKKAVEIQEESFSRDESSDALKDDTMTETSHITNGEEKKPKRQRADSSENGSPHTVPGQKDKKKKTKRQRIESSESENESPKQEEKQTEIKVETDDKPKIYESPKSKKLKVKIENSPLIEKNDKEVKKKRKTSAQSNKKAKVKEEKSPTCEVKQVKNPFVKKEIGFITRKETPQDSTETAGGEAIVAEEEYNPGKLKYHPVADACWRRGEEVPYLALARTLEAIEGTSARLRIVDILANYLRSVIALTPEDLLPSVYLCLNQLAPAYHSLELGIAETYLMKAIGACTGRTLAQVRAAAHAAGDLGRVAEQARATQRTLLAPPPLRVRRVLAALREVARLAGHASVNKKIAKIQALYTACRHAEARYLIRSLEGKLRIGLAEQSVLQALAVAAARTPPTPEGVVTLDAAEGLSPDQFKARVDEHALIIKTTFCECPNYELVVPALLQYGVQALPEHCKLTPGIPLKPMLAHPTKGLHEVFNRFEGVEFTCEWKYDGERAQLHVPAADGGAAPDLARAAVFSRNQEDNTSKYPDVLRRLPTLLRPSVTSCVLDAEAVAYDPATSQILPFQVLSTRKRKDASEADIRVQVCVYVFDLLYLNGRPLVREPLAERRALLHEHFQELEGAWQFARARDCGELEEVQQFLEESVRGSCEGLMVKMLRGENSRYDIARRSHNWLKLKKDYLEGVGDTLDVVVLGAYHGRGRRAGAGRYGGFLLACWDPDSEEFQSLCKLGTGFSDEQLGTLSAELDAHAVPAPPNYYRVDAAHAPDAWFAAACVWEVRCADLSLSPAHRAARGLVDAERGVSLRFPRFVRARPDKAPEQATTAQQVARLYLAQDQVRNNQPKHAAAAAAALDDFY